MLMNTVTTLPMKIPTIISIWYFMAVIGSLPPSICPVIIPGSHIRPIDALDAITGLKASLSAFAGEAPESFTASGPTSKVEAVALLFPSKGPIK